MKRKKLTEVDLINWWLEKYHNTNIAEIQALHPEWRADNPEYNSRMFYEAYQVTEAQHDEWHKWAIDAFGGYLGLSKKRADREFAWTYLNCAPMVKKDEPA